jgi:CoA:oxalate CoA-transferase
MNKILDDIRILDLTHVWYGPWCTLLLAEMGAEVIRVEPPWGAIDRIAEGALFGGVSYTFHHFNLNKKDLTLNLKSQEGLKIFKKLVETSDIVVQNFSPGTMERLGLGYEVLTDINPNIIYAALSGFGQDGPYSSRGSYAPIAESMSSHTRLTGDGVDVNGPPILISQSYGDLGPGNLAAMSILAALRHRDKTGEGQMIDVAQFDCMVALSPAITGYFLSGLKLWELREKYPRMRGIRELMKTKDGGWIMLAVSTASAIDSLRALFNEDDVSKEIVRKKVANMNRDEAVAYFVDADIPVSPVYQVDEVVEDPHINARNMFVEINHKKAGKIKVVNFPVKFSKTPGEIQTAAPELGEHNVEILTGLGYTSEDIRDLQQSGVISYAQRARA